MFSRFFIERPRFAFVISIILILSGTLAFQKLPIAEYPDVTPPSIMVGIRDGQSRSDALREAEEIGRIVDAQGEKLRLIDAYLAEGNIHPKWREMIKEYRQMIADGKCGKEAPAE